MNCKEAQKVGKSLKKDPLSLLPSDWQEHALNCRQCRKIFEKYRLDKEIDEQINKYFQNMRSELKSAKLSDKIRRRIENALNQQSQFIYPSFFGKMVGNIAPLFQFKGRPLMKVIPAFGMAIIAVTLILQLPRETSNFNKYENQELNSKSMEKFPSPRKGISVDKKTKKQDIRLEKDKKTVFDETKNELANSKTETSEEIKLMANSPDAIDKSSMGSSGEGLNQIDRSPSMTLSEDFQALKQNKPETSKNSEKQIPEEKIMSDRDKINIEIEALWKNLKKNPYDTESEKKLKKIYLVQNKKNELKKLENFLLKARK